MWSKRSLVDFGAILQIASRLRCEKCKPRLLIKLARFKVTSNRPEFETRAEARGLREIENHEDRLALILQTAQTNATESEVTSWPGCEVLGRCPHDRVPKANELQGLLARLVIVESDSNRVFVPQPWDELGEREHAGCA